MSDLIRRAVKNLAQLITPDRTAGQVPQQVRAVQAGSILYFDLEVLPLGVEAGRPTQPLTQLEVGQSYIVRVTASSKQSALYTGSTSYYFQQQVVLSGPLACSIAVAQLSHKYLFSYISVEQKTEHLQPGDEQGWVRSFRLDVGHDCPSGELDLCLQCEGMVPLPSVPSPTEIRVQVKGGNEQTIQVEVHHLAMAFEPPDKMAFLYVHSLQPGQLRFLGRSYQHPKNLVTLQDIPSPDIALSQNEEEYKYIKNLIGFTYDSSNKRLTHVIHWIDKLIKTDNQCCFTIIDLADTGIPWETLRDKEDHFLNTRAITTRLERTHYTNGLNQDFFQEKRIEGRIIASTPHRPLDNSIFHTLEDNIDDPEQLAYQLYNLKLLPAGLICITNRHMLFYNERKGIFQELVSRYSYKKIRFDQPGKKRMSNPFFLVNAPFSARLFCHQEDNFGFVHAVLDQIASNYLGPIGPMDIDVADLITREIYKRAQTAEGVQPAQVLQELRNKARDDFDQAINQNDKIASEKLLYYLSTYVYYGNPHIRLRIHSERNGQ